MDSSYKYDFVYHRESVSHKIWNEYLQTYKRPLIKMPAEDIKRAKMLLGQFVPIKKKFVVIHARDIGFYGNVNQNTRNADIFTYKAAIKYLIKQGYVVIRIGDKNMVKITPLLMECGEMLFDYAHSAIKSEMIDIYLLSNCAFMIGCSSGPQVIPPLFHVNCVLINWFNMSNAPYFNKSDITTFKKFRYKKNKELVPLKKLFESPFSLNPSRKDLDEIGVFLEDNSEQEILDTVVEFLENKDGTISDIQQKAKSYIKPENYAFGAEGNFSNTILKQYF